MRILIFFIIILIACTNKPATAQEKEWKCGTNGTEQCQITGEPVEVETEELTEAEVVYEKVRAEIRVFKETLERYIIPNNRFFPKIETCPTAEINLKGVFYTGIFNRVYKIDSHCEIIKENEDLIKVAGELTWIIIAITVILKT